MGLSTDILVPDPIPQETVMRRSGALTAVAALALSLVAAGQPHAGADVAGRAAAYHHPKVAFVGHARALPGGRAEVLAVYRCWGGNRGTHLWVSLKQGGQIDDHTAKELSQMEGTSELARAWYDTNPVAPRKVQINCNGRWQVQRYVVKREKGTLRAGRAFMQFCLFDSHSDPQGQDLSKGFAYNYRFVYVHR
ncbi:hypothetical protein ACVW2K_001841 [Nocardioides sp. HB32]